VCVCMCVCMHACVYASDGPLAVHEVAVDTELRGWLWLEHLDGQQHQHCVQALQVQGVREVPRNTPQHNKSGSKHTNS